MQRRSKFDGIFGTSHARFTPTYTMRDTFGTPTSYSATLNSSSKVGDFPNADWIPARMLWSFFGRVER